MGKPGGSKVGGKNTPFVILVRLFSQGIVAEEIGKNKNNCLIFYFRTFNCNAIAVQSSKCAHRRTHIKEPAI